MSRSENASVEERVAKATVRDPSLLTALEDAETEHGSMAGAVRHALATTYAGEESDETGVALDVPVKAREGHRKLVEFTGVGGRIELETSESILANHLNIKTESVRKVVIKPLVGAGLLEVYQGIHQVTLVVNDAESAADSAVVEGPNGDFATFGDTMAAGMEQSEPDESENADDRLDELAAAGEEVAHGDE